MVSHVGWQVNFDYRVWSTVSPNEASTIWLVRWAFVHIPWRILLRSMVMTDIRIKSINLWILIGNFQSWGLGRDSIRFNCHSPNCLSRNQQEEAQATMTNSCLMIFFNYVSLDLKHVYAPEFIILSKIPLQQSRTDVHRSFVTNLRNCLPV